MFISWFEPLADGRPTYRGTDAEVAEVTWPEFQQLLLEAWHVGDKRIGPGLSPVRLDPPKRLNENVQDVWAMFADCDHCTPEEVERVVAAFAGHACLVYSTNRHTEAEPRVRICAPLKTPIPGHLWSDTWREFFKSKGLQDLLDREHPGIDPQCKDPSRFYFAPSSATAEGDRVWVVLAGPFLELQPPAAGSKSGTKAQPRPSSAAGEISPLSNDMGALKERLKGSKWRDTVLNGEPIGNGPGDNHAAFLECLNDLAWRTVGFSHDAVLELLQPSFRHADHYGTPPEEEFWLIFPKSQEDWLEKRAERAAGVEKQRQRLLAKVQEIKKEQAAEAPEEEDGEQEETPSILVDEMTARMVEEAEEAIALDPRVYVTSAGLSRLVTVSGQPLPFLRDDTMPSIRTIDPDTLASWLTVTARWYRLGKKGVDQPSKPPRDVVNALLNHGEWPHVRQLSGFVEAPAFRPDGSLIEAPGYDASTGLFYARTGELLPLGSTPSQDYARACADELLEAVRDFPFVDDAARSGWLAAVLTPFVRATLQGVVPMFCVDASDRGCGKTLLVDAMNAIRSGRPIAKMSNTTDDDEMRKRLLAIAMAGKPVVTFDNVKDALGTPSLDLAMTAGTIEDRVLGVNRIVSAPLRVTWFATGNNLTYEGDMIRRVLPIRLVSDLERPSERGGFAHPELLEWIIAERPRLLRAAINVWRGFFAAGGPQGEAKPWGSFERWQHLAPACVRWLGFAAPEGARIVAQEAQSISEQVSVLLAEFERLFGQTPATTAKFVQKCQGAAREVLKDLCGGYGSDISNKRVGRLLLRNRDRVIGGRRLVQSTVSDVSSWRVVKVE